MALEGLSVREVSDRWQHKFTFQTGMSSFSNNSDMLVVLCLCSKINTSKLFTYFAEIWIRCNNFAIYSVLSSFFSYQQYEHKSVSVKDVQTLATSVEVCFMSISSWTFGMCAIQDEEKKNRNGTRKEGNCIHNENMLKCWKGKRCKEECWNIQ
jgi:hypothetical protein